MYLHKIKRLNQEQLFQELKSVPLLGRPDIFPYAKANFEIRLADPATLQPSAFYVLKFELSFLSLLLDELSEFLSGIDRLDTLLEYQDEYGFVHRMIPPVVELTDFGKWMILDGEHRSFIAKNRNIKIPMLFISNIQIPYPCLLLPEGWKSVNIVDKVPVHKRLRRPGLNDTPETEYSLHRDLRKFGSKGTRKPLSPI